MTDIRTHRRSSGFTLIELLVVISIIAVLLALTTAAVVRVLAGQTQSSTEATLKKLHSGLTQQGTAVKDQARNTFSARGAAIDPHYSGWNEDAARSNYITAQMQRELPVNFNEVRNNIPYGGPPAGAIPPKKSYVDNVNLAPAGANPAEQGSVCLHMALLQGRRGMEFKLEEAVGVSSIRMIGNAKYIVDSWGTPIILDRVGNDPAKPVAKSAGADRTFGTSDDISSDQLH